MTAEDSKLVEAAVPLEGQSPSECPVKGIGAPVRQSELRLGDRDIDRMIGVYVSAAPFASSVHNLQIISV